MWLQYNKIVNLRLAIKRLNGVIIRPGEIFSYWKVIGKPSKRKGYLPGMQLRNGSFIASTGGGLCQLSNLIYWMVLHTPLTVIERWRHSYDVFPDSNRTLPFGSGATCSYNYIDLQFNNPTQHLFQLKLSLTETHLCGEFLSDHPLDYKYEVIEEDHKIEQQFWGGYTRHNKLYKLYKNLLTNEILKKELVSENHALMMYNPLLESNTPCSLEKNI